MYLYCTVCETGQYRQFWPTPPVFGAPFEFSQDLWQQKTTARGLSYGFVWTMIIFSHFDTMPACDRQTDRRTQCYSAYRSSVAR